MKKKEKKRRRNANEGKDHVVFNRKEVMLKLRQRVRLSIYHYDGQTVSPTHGMRAI